MFDRNDSTIIDLLRELVGLARAGNSLKQEALNEARTNNKGLRAIEAEQDTQTKQLGKIEALLSEVAAAEQVRDFTLSQIQGDLLMAITGTVVGTTSTFNISNVPPTNFVPLQSGPLVAVDDTNVTLGAVDASGNFTAAVAASDTGAAYNLTITGTAGDGTALSHAFAVPILPLPPPPPVQVSDFSLNQIS